MGSGRSNGGLVVSFIGRSLGRLTPQAEKMPGVENTRDAVWVYLKCDKCQELISLRIRKSSEIQRDEGGGGKSYDMFVNKTVVGSKCFNRMDLRLEFDKAYRVVNSELSGGSFVPKEEFEGA